MTPVASPSPGGPARLDVTRALPLQRLMSPRSIAVVGVSSSPGAIGTVVLGNLDRFGFAGELHVVSRGRAEVNGRACVGTIAELPSGIDVVVLGVPNEAVVDAVRTCAAMNVGAVIVYAAGFGEADEAGRVAQERITEIALQSGMLLVGPNCLGLNNFVGGVPLTFVATQPDPVDRPTLAILAQSGGMMANLRLSSAARHVQVAYSISTGNEAVLGIEDYLDFLIDSPHAKVIGLYVEQVRRPALFLSLLAKARRCCKPIVLLHTGRSAAAREATTSHTGALAGDHALMSALVKAHGVIMVDTIDELYDVCWMMVRFAPLAAVASGGAGILTDSGAFKGFALDFCEEIGLPLPALAPATVAALRDHLPTFSTATNPLDMTAQGLRDTQLYGAAARELLADPNLSCVMVCLMPGAPASGLAKFRSIEPLLASAGKPLVYVMMGDDSPLAAELTASIAASGMPFFRSPERALRALRHVIAHARAAAATATATATESGVAAHGSVRLPIARLEGRGTLPEYRSKAWLTELGLTAPAGALAHSIGDAAAIAARLGYPVVLKAQAAVLPHKSDAGGVVMNLGNEAELSAAWKGIIEKIACTRPGLRLDGMLVEKMMPRGLELVVGAKRDAAWGPVVMVGLGGIWIEILEDIRLMPVTVSKADIVAELLELRAAPLLQGARGIEPIDLDRLAETIAVIAMAMRAEPRLQEIEINPLMVYPGARNAVMLDALIVVAHPAPVLGVQP